MNTLYLNRSEIRVSPQDFSPVYLEQIVKEAPGGKLENQGGVGDLNGLALGLHEPVS